ncbi:hypothetical protein M427DRAFT_44954 [Gonapodya prolifera JEL478]|uniref:Uncharacterized protein n=1 Tax=Gonapodya prolifera (strain JEL478) TaxID=1344416 RepID=A0A139ACQ0_GONPJ|nr:hypothetical protein M427DRAFT_44954 [Gonapodya prolifera JEL478]|eukprot:KXS14528.1 hypothetical protein M427DRAFT_44954 [Gonapodya prolifera JEL478]
MAGDEMMQDMRKKYEEMERRVKDLERKMMTVSLEEGCDASERKKELHYQRRLEQELGGSHKKTIAGTTDVTTETMHCEIKNWNQWYYAIGQLYRYNLADPRDELRVYLFGEMPKGERLKNAKKLFHKAGIAVYYFDEEEDIVCAAVALNYFVCQY